MHIYVVCVHIHVSKCLSLFPRHWISSCAAKSNSGQLWACMHVYVQSVCVCVCARACVRVCVCVCVYVCVWNTNVPHDHNKYKTKTYSLAVWGHQVCAWNQPLKKKINVIYFRQNSLQWVSLLRKIQPQFTQPDNITHSAEPKMYNKQNKTAEIWLKIKNKMNSS